MGSSLDFLSSGEVARLIPVIADSRREQRVASVFLATLSAVPTFATHLLSSIGVRLGKRSVVDTYTEIVLKSQSQAKDRPDGLIVVSTGSKTWKALVEAKIGKSDIEEEQVGRYLQLARDNGIDAVVTISNQFSARPTHSPVRAPKTMTRRVDLFHWSWRTIATEAVLLQSQEAVTDPDQAFILREFVRFISHPSVGLSDFSSMPSQWQNAVTLIKGGGVPGKSSSDVAEIVAAWHQETRDLALKLTRHLATKVDVRLSRVHASDPERRHKDDCANLSMKNCLEVDYDIPNAASPLSVIADLKGQTIRVGMETGAPQDRQTTLARVNWLLRQLKPLDDSRLFVRVIWPSRARDTVCRLSELRENTKELLAEATQPPRSFEVFMLSDDGRRFSGRRTFIEELEKIVPVFYDSVGQRLERWIPKPPKPVTDERDQANEPKTDAALPAPGELDAGATQLPPNNQSHGNQHTDLLEIPSFLLRTPSQS